MILSAPAPVLWAVGGVFLVLAAASLAVGLLRRTRSAADLGELAARTRSWWVMAVVFAAAILLSRTVSIVFFAFVSFLALKEYLSLIPTRRADRTVLFFAYLAIPVQFWWIGIGWYGMFVIWVPVYMLLFLPLPMLAIGETAGFLTRHRHPPLGADDDGVFDRPCGLSPGAADPSGRGGGWCGASALSRHPDRGERRRPVSRRQVVRPDQDHSAGVAEQDRRGVRSAALSRPSRWRWRWRRCSPRSTRRAP